MWKGSKSTVTSPLQTDVETESQPTRFLLVEPDEGNAKAIRKALDGEASPSYAIEHYSSLGAALPRLTDADVAAVLVGPDLPDSNGLIESIGTLRNANSRIMILPLCGRTENLWCASCVDPHWLPEALSCVAARQQADERLVAAEEALFREKELARATLASTGDAVLVTDTEGRVTYINPAAEAMTGWPVGEAVGKPLDGVFQLISSDTREPVTNPAMRAIREDRPVGLEGQAILVSRDGTEHGIEDTTVPVRDSHGDVFRAVIVFCDVNCSPAMARKMAYLANHDSLTGLCSRALLEERLKQTIGFAQRHQKQTAVLFLDLDGFKAINDSLGHVLGDHVLQKVGEVLTGCVRTTDTVCRHGGDEFILLLGEIEQRSDAAHVAEKILASFAPPLTVDGLPLRIQGSIGIAVYPDDGESADAIIKQADAAMYEAKTNQEVSYSFAGGAADSRQVARDCSEHRLWRAFQAGEFVLYYQPQVDLVSGRIGGVEVLVRWQHPERGLIYPSEFMPVAEHSGLMVAMGRWILQEACRQVAVWRSEERGSLPVAINVSAPEFLHPEFVEFTHDVLKQTGIEPADLELEFTEDVLMRDPALSMENLGKLRDIGVRLAIDDFGSGGSSLRYLSRFPADTLKIDKCLMEDVSADPATSIVLRSLVSMGRDLKCRLVAEGVENVHQLGFVQAQLFDVGQGFQFGQPQTADEFSQLLESGQ